MINFDNMTFAGMLLVSWLAIAIVLEGFHDVLTVFIGTGFLQNLRWYSVRNFAKRLSGQAYRMFVWWMIGGIGYGYIFGVNLWKHWGFY